MKILIAINNSKFSENVIGYVAGQFRNENAEVLVMHVLQPVEPVAPPEMAQGYAPELEGQKEPAHALVDRAVRELHAAGFKAHSVVQIGDVLESILDATVTWNADLVVVGLHEHRGISHLLMGSVAESVARDAKCSVEIVRTPVIH